MSYLLISYFLFTVFVFKLSFTGVIFNPTILNSATFYNYFFFINICHHVVLRFSHPFVSVVNLDTLLVININNNTARPNK